MRLGSGTPKGYERALFVQAWKDFLPSNEASIPACALVSDSEPQQPQQSNVYAGSAQFSKPQQKEAVADRKSQESSMFMRIVADVADEIPNTEVKGNKKVIEGKFGTPSSVAGGKLDKTQKRVEVEL